MGIDLYSHSLYFFSCLTIYDFFHSTTRGVKLSWCVSFLWSLCFADLSTCSAWTKYNWHFYDLSWLWQQKIQRSRDFKMLFGFTSVPPVFCTNHICCESLFTACNSGTFVLSESKVLRFHFKMQSFSLAPTYQTPFCCRVIRSYSLSFPLFSVLARLLCDVSGTYSFHHWLTTSFLLPARKCW